MPQLWQLDQELSDFFEVRQLTLDIAKGATGLRQAVFCTDPSGLIDRLLYRRRVAEGDFLVKIGIDGGGGFLKVCLNILRVEDDERPRRRATYAEGACASSFSDGGVKRLLILAIVEDVCESYSNLQALLQLLKLEEVSFTLAVDMKLANALLGLQCASSSHPCPWCPLHRREFASLDACSVPLRTLGTIRQNVIEYQQEVERCGAARTSAANFENCVRMPLLNLPDATVVLEALPPMQLHLLLGVVNRLYKALDYQLQGQPGFGIRAEDYARALGIGASPYHGGQFTGNDCHKLLENADVLEQMFQSCGALCAMPIVRAFRAFREVQRRCFGLWLLDGYDAAIEQFACAYRDLDLLVSPKVHAVIQHVGAVLHNQSTTSGEPPHGLGFWSEQASESVHADFSRMWERCFKMALSQPSYARQLLTCVVQYNSQHI